MYYLENLKEKLNAIVGQALSVQPTELDWTTPPDSRLGDLALPCFFKIAGQSPNENAVLAVQALVSAGFKAQASGPYVNLTLEQSDLAAGVLSDIEKGDYGSRDLASKQEVMIEFSNVNTHKDYHLGHLRNLFLGDSLTKIYQAAGFKVWPVSYINDFGIHVAKTIWAWKRKAPLLEGREAGAVLGQTYAAAVEELNHNPEAESEMRQVMKNIETKTGEDYDLWLKTRDFSLDYFNKIYKQLGVEFKETYLESDHIETGKCLVDKLLKNGVLKLSQGAVIADLEEYGLGVLVLLRSDGTATYPVADLALAQAKFENHQLSASVYITDNRQELYFKQLFKLLALAGYQAELIHLPYEFVKLPEGMMSSRSGNAPSYQEIFGKLCDKLKTEVMSRHADWSETETTATAEKLARAVLKFELLKVGVDKIITFDLEAAMKLEGFTVIYIEYMAARLASILRKAGDAEIAKASKGDTKLLTELSEKALLIKLATYPEITAEAFVKRDPSVVAKYLYELAKFIGDYYNQAVILDENKALRLARLRLIKATEQTLDRGLKLLGIEMADKM